MNIRATFVGVGKHEDGTITELSGPPNDARALWGLFTDTVPSAVAELLVDENATADRVRHAIQKTITEASPEDVVVFSFSGHGSRSHSIVLYDTRREVFGLTSISMSEIADAFKASKARAIVCILDCCFSGKAPAKVLEDSPQARDLDDPLALLMGKGRLLIAACRATEPAWEVNGQGLLTAALLELLQSGDEIIDVCEIANEVMKRVQTRAAMLGYAQLPVVTSYVEGGLRFPKLVPGDNFHRYFPRRSTRNVTKALDDLVPCGIPAETVEIWKKEFTSGLNELQIASINESRVLDGAPLLVVAPTSSGKTFIGEMAAAKALATGKKTVFLLPYKALVNEKYLQFQKTYGGVLNYRVIRCSGDYADETSRFIAGRFDLALITYETFLSLIVNAPFVLERLGLVVLDEAQFITDPNRGITVELILTSLISARARGVSPQLVALSAVIGEINEFDQWLGLARLLTTKRPVPLIEGVIDRNGIFQYLDTDGSQKEERFISPVVQRRDKPSNQDIIVPLAKKLVGAGERIVVIRNRRGAAQGCAQYLAKELSLPSATQVIRSLPTHDRSASSEQLVECLKGGTAFHTSNLSREERELIESVYRKPNGPIHALAATTTVAAGINTPASTIIIAEQEFLGEDGRPFTIAEYKNMAGRAGRYGFQEIGRSIVCADTTSERRQLFAKYVLGSPEPLRSSFNPTKINTWLLRLLAQVKSVPRANVASLLANTYGGFLAARSQTGWIERAQSDLLALLERMERLELVEQDDDGRVSLTLLGRACGASTLSFESSLRLVELAKRRGLVARGAMSLVAIVQALPELDSVFTPVMKKGSSESVRPGQAAQRFGPEVVQLFQQQAADMNAYYKRCKRACIAYDWMVGTPIEEIERVYTANPYQGNVQAGDIRGIANATRFNLRSAFQIVQLILPDVGEENFDVLLKQLEVGLPASAIPLLDIPLSLTRGEYLTLFKRGILSQDALWLRSDDEIASILSIESATLLAKLRPIQRR